MENSDANLWRKCSVCKKSINFGTRYYTCSVSTCNGQRTGYVFCSVVCFESHLPGARHRDAGAIENQAPKRAPARIIVSNSPPAGSANASPSPSMRKESLPREVLIIASRLKEYIQARADMNTSGAVMDILSDYVRVIADRAIDNARAEGRKTVLDRDLAFLKKN